MFVFKCEQCGKQGLKIKGVFNGRRVEWLITCPKGHEIVPDASLEITVMASLKGKN